MNCACKRCPIFYSSCCCEGEDEEKGNDVMRKRENDVL